MKKIIFIVFIVISLVAFVSCSEKTPDPGDNTQQPLTLDFAYNGVEIDATITFENYENINLSYRINDNLDKIPVTGGKIEHIQAGDKITLFAKRTEVEDGKYLHIDCDANCFIYGNIMSLISEQWYEDVEVFPNAFRELFKGNTNIKNHYSETLVLPAVTLAEGCYYEMFRGCIGLNNLTYAMEISGETYGPFCCYGMFADCISLAYGPTLKAVTMAESSCESMFDNCKRLGLLNDITAKTMGVNSCRYMFRNCTSLHYPPELSATVMGEGCYQGMFYKCTGLLETPSVLPAKTLAKSCYEDMFTDCDSITKTPEILATTVAESCCKNMFHQCDNLLTTMDVLLAEEMADSCYYGMFSDCKVLTEGPELPATTLAPHCYQEMFKSCFELSNPTKVLPATTLAESCYESMFEDCGTKLENAPEMLATTVASRSCYAMFDGCMNLHTPPKLYAEHLFGQCYQFMFRECTNLDWILCLATSFEKVIIEGQEYAPTHHWVGGINTASRDLIIADGTMPLWTIGDDGRPANWDFKIYTPEE